MTIREAALDYQYDVGIYYGDFEDKEGWWWEVNGGYCCTGSSNYFSDPLECIHDLETFLETFEGYHK